MNNGVPLQNNSNGAAPATNAGSNAGAGSGGSGLQNNSTSQPGKGSGRFTNLQSYINANQGAGNNISNAVQKNVSNSVAGNQQIAQTADTTGQQNVNQGNQIIAQGQQFQTQMSAPTFTPDQAIQFAQNQGNVQAVNNLETGKAIDTTALQQQNQQANSAAATFENQANQYQQQAGTETGQQNLLGQTYGGQYKPVYSAGDSRLDNMLLQATPGSLNSLQSAIGGINQNANTIASDVANQATGIQNLGTQQTNLGQQLQTTTTGNVNNLQTSLQNQIPTFNQNIAAGQKSAQEFLDFNNQAISNDQFKQLYGVDKTGYGGNQDLFNQFGLQQGQQTFNEFNNPDLKLNSVATLGPNAQSWQDVSNQQNVNQYAALAQLANIDKNNYALTQASTINPQGYTLNTGANSLEGQIQAQKDAFLQDAMNKVISSSNGYVNGVKGTASVNVGNVLNNLNGIYNSGDIGMQYTTGDNTWGNGAAAYNGPSLLADNSARTAATNEGTTNQGYIPKAFGAYSGIEAANPALGILNNALPNNPIQQGVAAVGNLANQAANIATTAFGGSVGNDIGRGEWWGQHQTSGRSQDEFLNSNLSKQIQDYLNQQGFNNYITNTGVQTADNTGLQAINKFGYSNPGGDINLSSTTVGAGPQQGIYQPAVQQALQQLAGGTAAGGQKIVNQS